MVRRGSWMKLSSAPPAPNYSAGTYIDPKRVKALPNYHPSQGIELKMDLRFAIGTNFSFCH